MKVKCPKCATLYQIDVQKKDIDTVKIKCKKCGTIFAVKIPSPQPVPKALPPRKVIIAMEDTGFMEELKSLLSKHNFLVTTATDGLQVLDYLSSEKPDFMILDVVLPKVFGFEITDIVRKRENLQGVKILLVGTYERGKYVRYTEEKYGADAIIDKGKLKADPLDALKDFLAITPPPAQEKKPAPPPPPRQQVIKAPPQKPVVERKKEVEEQFKDLSPEQREAVEKAKRLARLIVSDILLYNPDKVEQGIKSGNFYSLLEKDISDGKKLYEERVPQWIRERWSFLEEELEKLIEKKKKEYGLS